MGENLLTMSNTVLRRWFGGSAVFILLAIEFLDEFVFGAGEAAWPYIRNDLALNYVQIGTLIALPKVISNLIEPVLGILADTWKRRVLIWTGGMLFALALFLTAISWGFVPLLLAFVIFGPASGAFVSLSQATLMDMQPHRREQNMARWTLAGSLGVVAGPLCLNLAVWLDLGWRGLYIFFALLATIYLILGRGFRFVAKQETGTNANSACIGLKIGIKGAIQALQRKEVWRWLILLEFSDLMLDVLLGFLALYLVDVVGATPSQAALAVSVWTGVGLLGDFLLIPLLERLPGLVYLRYGAVLELVFFGAFLLVPQWIGKIIFLALLGLFNSGWYAILKAELYSALPGQSGTSLALNNLGGILGSLIPLGLGWVAQRYNLQVTMWLLILGPIALWVGLPRPRPVSNQIA